MKKAPPKNPSPATEYRTGAPKKVKKTIEVTTEERGIGVHPIILIIGFLGWAIFIVLILAEL